jgi:hypothetical protein
MNRPLPDENGALDYSEVRDYMAKVSTEYIEHEKRFFSLLVSDYQIQNGENFWLYFDHLESVVFAEIFSIQSFLITLKLTRACCSK